MNDIFDKRGEGYFSYWEKDGKVCWELLCRGNDLITYLETVRPNFLEESMDEVINLDWMNPHLRTASYMGGIIKVRNRHLREGWKVAHLMIYCRWDTIKKVLEKGLLPPMSDLYGRSLSDMSALRKNEFPKAVQSFEEVHPAAFDRLKLIEFYHSQKRKMLLFTSIMVEEKNENKRTKKSNNKLPLDLLKFTSEFLFPNHVIKGKLVEVVV